MLVKDPKIMKIRLTLVFLRYGSRINMYTFALDGTGKSSPILCYVHYMSSDECHEVFLFSIFDILTKPSKSNSFFPCISAKPLLTCTYKA